MKEPTKRRWVIMGLIVAACSSVMGAGVGLYDPAGNPYVKSSLEDVRKAAVGGAPAAQTRMGDLYWMGVGVAADYVEAARWYRLAADQGYAPSQYNLGALYQHGFGVPRDFAASARWFHLAADQNMAQAQLALGNAFLLGEGVPVDNGKAFEWYRKAAAHGLPEAGKRAAQMLFHGVGVRRDYRAAEQRLLRIANERPDDLEVQFALGFIYYNGGDGVARDAARAAPHYFAAAQRGYALAQHNLGLQHELGEGVGRQPVGAYAWYLLAAAQGVQESLRALGNLQRVMTPEQIREAEKLAAGFHQAFRPPPERPLLEVRDLRIEPAVVARGSSYAFTVEFAAASPRGEPKYPVEVGFRVLKGAKVLFESRKARVMVENDGSATYTRPDLPCRAPPGTYQFQVVLTDGTLQTEKTVALVVR